VRILVTGAAGFIGSHLCQKLCQRGHTIVGVDCPDRDSIDTTRNLRALSETAGSSFIDWDILRRPGHLTWPDELIEMMRKKSFDAVVHLAAKVDLRDTDTEAFYDINMLGTLRTLEAMRAYGIKRFVFASSAAVYGNSLLPFLVGHECRPLSHYGASKLQAEIAIGVEHRLHGLDAVILRLFNVYGPRQRSDLVFHKFARLMTSGQPIVVYGDPRLTSRDYVHVDDVTEAILLSLEKVNRDPRLRTFNVGSGRALYLDDIIKKLSAVFDVEPDIRWLPAREEESLHTLSDNSAILEELGWKPEIDIDAGMASFEKWFKEEVMSDG